MPWVKGQSGNPEGARTKARRFGATLDRVIAQDAAKEEEKQQLRQVAEKLLEKAAAGDLPSLEFLAERLDGKVTQPIGGDPENPLQVIARVIRDPK